MSSKTRQKLASEMYECVARVFKQKLRSNYKETLLIIKNFYTDQKDAYVFTDKITLTENIIQLWFNEIYPLMFDSDPEIRESVTELIPSFVEEFNKTECDFDSWPEIKNQLINEYVKKLIEIRNNEDENWCNIWNILITTISTDLINKAVIINKFLEVVEYAFRSERLPLKVQAYVCWKHLIELFAKKKEIHLAKRMRLLLIPFKTSKIISAELSEVKFRAYWCFITKQNREILNDKANCSDILIPFLDFLFGPLRDEAPLLSYLNKNYTKLTSCKVFNELTPYSVFALISLIGTPNAIVLNLMKNENLEHESNLIDLSVFKIIGNILINACSEATVVLSNYDHEHNIDICKCLWMNLLNKIDLAGTYDLFRIVVDNIHALIKLNHENENIKLENIIILIIKLICTSKLFPFSSIQNNMLDSSSLTLGIKIMTKLILHKDLIIKNSELDIIINNLYDFNKFESLINTNETLHTSYWSLLDTCINLLLSFGQTTNNNEEFANNKIFILTKVWLKLYDYILNYLNNIDYNKLNHEEYLYCKYMSWPIIHFNKINKNTIRSKWSIKVKDPIFCNKLCNSLSRSIIPVLNIHNIDDVFKFYIIILKSLRPNIDDFMPKDTFKLLMKIMTIQSLNGKVILFVFIEMLTLFIKELNDKQAELLVPTLIQFLTNIYKGTGLINLNYVKEFKIFLSTKYKNNYSTTTNNLQNKNDVEDLLRLCKPIVKKKDEYALINNVWTMDPKKLTEHQKEKMKERRTDIPALYNDLSQSNDTTTLKMWTPNKINGATTSDCDNNENKVNSEVTVTPTGNILNNKTTIIDNNKNINNNLNTIDQLPTVTAPDIENTIIAAKISAIINNNNNNTGSNDISNNNNNKSQSVEKKCTKMVENKVNTTQRIKSIEKMPLERKQTRLSRNNNNFKDSSIINDVPLMTSSHDVRTRVEQLDLDEKKKKRVFYELQKLQIVGIPVPGNTSNNNSEKKRKLRSTRSTENKYNDSIGNLTQSELSDRNSPIIVELPKLKRSKIVGPETVVVPEHVEAETETAEKVVLETITPEIITPETTTPETVISEIVNPPNISIKNKKTQEEQDENESLEIVTPEKNKEMQEKLFETYTKSPTIVLPKLKFTTNDGKLMLATAITKSTGTTTVGSIPTPEEIEKINNKKSIKTNLNDKLIEKNMESSESLINKVNRKVVRNKNELLEARLLNKKLNDTDENNLILNDSDLMTQAEQTQSSTTEIPLNINDKNIANMDTIPFDSDAINTTTEFNIKCGEVLAANYGIDDLQIVDNSSVIKEIEVETSTENTVVIPMGNLIGTIKSENINDMDTKLNTYDLDIESIFTNLMEMEKTPSPSPPSPSEPSLPQNTTEVVTDKLNTVICDKINDDEVTAICKNTSIQSSPELNDVNERNKEFLNDTIDISPISRVSPPPEIQLSPSQPATSEIKKIVLDKVSSYQSTPNSHLINQNLSPHTMNIMESLNRQKKDCASPSARKQLLMPPCSSPTNVRFIPAGSRGAQFVQLAMNNLGQSTPKQIISEKKIMSPSSNTKFQGVRPELFAFNNRVPSPSASPSCSILKRKIQDETVEDVIESPAQKRKRVSFHDPPVSALKEFTRHIDEIKVLGCLSPLIGQNSNNSKLVRKCRRDSIQEIENLSSKTDTNENPDDSVAVKNIVGDNSMINNETSDTTGMESLRMNSTTEESINDCHNNSNGIIEGVEEEEEENEHDVEEPQPSICKPSDLIITSDVNKPKITLQEVFKIYTMEDLFEYHLTTPGHTLNSHLVHTLTKEISSLMKNNNKIKNNVLEELSEKHSIEFLQHAIQENSSDVVCNILTSKVCCDYLYKNSQNKTSIKDDLINLFTNFLNNEMKILPAAATTTKLTESASTSVKDSSSLVSPVIVNEENKFENNILNYVKETLKHNELLKMDFLNELLLKNSNSNNDGNKKLLKNITLKCLYKTMEMDKSDVNDVLKTMEE